MEEAKKETLDNEELNKAAHDYKNAITLVEQYIEKISGTGAKRVLNSLLQFPFENAEPKFIGKLDEQIFLLCLHILGNKAIMEKYVLLHKEEIENAVVENALNETLRKGESNEQSVEKIG